ncbi:11081_t:CDS:2, partial [Entrophospora sp. SA101]
IKNMENEKKQVSKLKRVVDNDKIGESSCEIIEENSPIPMVVAAVSIEDNPKLPCLTFRFWILSTFFTILGATLSEFYYFRPNGRPFNIKEHVCIAVATGAGGGSAYAT